MKHCFAICFGFLFSICLMSSFVMAQSDPQDFDQIVHDLQVSQTDFEDLYGDLSDISIDDIAKIEEGVSASDLTFMDKAQLAIAYLKIRLAEKSEDAKKHILRNQRSYVWGTATGLIVLAAFAFYYFGKKNSAPVPQN